jgi:uncharacterized protein YndB with AHSA1/START domain
MLTLIVIVVVALVAVLLLLVARQPSTFAVRRAIVVRAAPERIFALLDDFHRWPAWSPWEQRDPRMRREYSGAERGPGAAYAWDGDKAVGQGRMAITGVDAPRRLDIQLDFLQPFEAHNRTVFSLQPRDGGTEVLWEMSGPANAMTRVMQLAGAMDRMVGKDFEAGLARLKAVVPCSATA